MNRATLFLLSALLSLFILGEIQADDGRLIGRWVSQLGERSITLEIVSYNQLLFDAVPHYYRQFPGLLQIRGDSGPVDYPYGFENEVLVLTFPEGYQLKFVKEGDSTTAAREAIIARQSGRQDEQLRMILSASPWCIFSFSDRSRHSQQVRREERRIEIKFYPDGTFSQHHFTGGYSSGNASMMMGQMGSTTLGHWRLQQGVLYISNSGEPMKPVPLDIRFDPAGNPIIYYFGREYVRCN